MLKSITKDALFHEYYAQWIRVYKEGAIRKVTMDKYLMTQSWLKRLAPDLKVHELSRITYQQLINDYAVYHEKQTTMDFHHQLKCAILDAVDEGLIERDPTRKVIIKGRPPKAKKVKYLNQFELHTLLNTLNLEPEINWDWFILLVAKTGMRFSEALALTPKDFDFPRQTLSVSKTWNYTHASLLLFAGVSIASVARRLGHASMTTTQKTYLHIIQELESKDIDLVMRSLSELS